MPEIQPMGNDALFRVVVLVLGHPGRSRAGTWLALCRGNIGGVYGRCPRRFSPTSRGVIAMTPDEPTVEEVKAPEAAPAVEAVPTEAPAVEAPADAPAAVEAPKAE